MLEDVARLGDQQQVLPTDEASCVNHFASSWLRCERELWAGGRLAEVRASAPRRRGVRYCRWLRWWWRSRVEGDVEWLLLFVFVFVTVVAVIVFVVVVVVVVICC